MASILGRLISHTVTAGIFAIYPIVVVAVLVGFGGISDHIGRRAAMLMGLAASLAGTLLFAVASSVIWLFLARALMGVGVGLTAGPSTAAVLEFTGGDPGITQSLKNLYQGEPQFAAQQSLDGGVFDYVRKASTK